MPIRAAVIMVLTIVFGIFPATALVLWAVMLGVGSLAALVMIDEPGPALLAFLFVAASVMAVYGYVALFHAARDVVTPMVARWLGAGVVANVIGIGILAEQTRWFAPEDWLVFAAPLVLGSAH